MDVEDSVEISAIGTPKSQSQNGLRNGHFGARSNPRRRRDFEKGLLAQCNRHSGAVHGSDCRGDFGSQTPGSVVEISEATRAVVSRVFRQYISYSR